MFAPRYFPPRYFAPRYFPPDDGLQGAAGSIQPGGFRIGFHQDRIKFVSRIPEASFEIEPFQVKDTSRDFQLEIERHQLGIKLIESKIKILEMETSLGEFLIQREIDHIQLIALRLRDGLELLERVRKLRVDEEEIIVILIADD